MAPALASCSLRPLQYVLLLVPLAALSCAVQPGPLPPADASVADGGAPARDAGTPFDASLPDGSTAADGGASMDAQVPSDAGAPDAGAAPDAQAPCPPVLQAAIDAAPSGGTLELTGCVYGSGATVDKPLTIVGGTVNVPPGGKGIIVQADDVTLDRTTIDGQVTAFAGIWAESAARLTVKDCTIHDCVYAGVMVISGSGGSITGCSISRIGVVGYEANGMNAYGIALTDTGGAPTTGMSVSGNTVDDVPQWHGLDTHGGRNLVFNDNVIHRTNRAIFLTSSANGPSRDIVASRNQMDTPTPRVDVLTTYPYNEVGITVVAGASNVTGDGNHFDGWPAGNHIDTQGGPNGFTNSVVTHPQ